jgi:hypothetical protein
LLFTALGSVSSPSVANGLPQPLLPIVQPGSSWVVFHELIAKGYFQAPNPTRLPQFQLVTWMSDCHDISLFCPSLNNPTTPYQILLAREKSDDMHDNIYNRTLIAESPDGAFDRGKS